MPWLDLIVPRSASRLRHPGEVSEWLKELAWKASGRVKPPRGFESHPLRCIADEDEGEVHGQRPGLRIRVAPQARLAQQDPGEGRGPSLQRRLAPGSDHRLGKTEAVRRGNRGTGPDPEGARPPGDIEGEGEHRTLSRQGGYPRQRLLRGQHHAVLRGRLRVRWAQGGGAGRMPSRSEKPEQPAVARA